MYRLIAILIASIAWLALSNAHAAAPTADGRLSDEYKWGRCVLEVDGKTYISGRCSYLVGERGWFEVVGPLKFGETVDLQRPDRYTYRWSEGYFAFVYPEGTGAEGFWNEEPLASHAQAPLGILKRRGACWVNKRARVCLWRK